MAGSGRYTVLLDANVLYPNVLRDLLLSLASAGLYHARWTDRINEEWTRNLVADRPDIDPRIPELLKLVNQSVPDCLVENYDILIDQLELPDPDDRHVLAAAGGQGEERLRQAGEQGVLAEEAFKPLHVTLPARRRVWRGLLR